MLRDVERTEFVTAMLKLSWRDENAVDTADGQGQMARARDLPSAISRSCHRADVFSGLLV
jgi:hypothetical protein